MQLVTSLRLVADSRTMVLRGRRTVLVVFSSCRPIVSATGRRLFGDPVGDLSEMSQRPVADQLQTDPNTAKFGLCHRPVCDWSPTGLREAATGHRSVADQLQPSGNRRGLIADAVPL